MLQQKNRLRITLMMAFVVTVTVMSVIPNTAMADELKDFILNQLDGKGTVNAINVDSRTIIVDDRPYYLSRNVNVFDIEAKRHLRVNHVRTRHRIGFKTSALTTPTAPYDQLITKIWVFPTDRR